MQIVDKPPFFSPRNVPLWIAIILMLVVGGLAWLS
jgi:hypothetical protein